MKQETIDRIRKFTADREWEQYHTPANLAKSISIEANELLECFQWSDTDFDLKHVKEELADVMVYCRNLLDELDLDEDEIINSKMDQNEEKYPVEKARGSAAKYDRLDDISTGEDLCMSEKAVPQKKSFQEWMQSLKDYDLQINDFNMALMLLFYLKNTPNEHVIFVLEQLMHGARYTDDRPSNTDRAIDTYKSVKKHFTSAVNAERRKVGSNATDEVAAYTEKDSAAHVLLMFREDPEREIPSEALGETPNLGNVRRVDCRQTAEKPCAGYQQFLTDWLASLREEY